MPESLKVIALISGGKDSLFSILHCLANGHEVVALANLFPEPTHQVEDSAARAFEAGYEYSAERSGKEVDDIESHMYQTIGHSILPLYASALDLPLYRQPIRGSAMNKSKTYSSFQQPQDTPNLQPLDETESLIPLLQRIKSIYPEANAISTGAILSTYQRTRVESVALRLDLIPLSYLWQFPLLEPYMQSSLLHDMRAVGMDARIVKVASGGLDTAMLWENVTDEKVIRKLGKLMQMYADADGMQVGAVLGEGGEFETLAIDGPVELFVRKIVITEDKVEVVYGEGGTAFLRILEAKAADRQEEEEENHEEQVRGDQSGELARLRIPNLWDDEFLNVLHALESDSRDAGDHPGTVPSSSTPPTDPEQSHSWLQQAIVTGPSTIYLSNITSTDASASPGSQSTPQAVSVINAVRDALSALNLSPADISFTTILLRSMSSFSSVNKIYGALFTLPNPPARVTVAVGDALPPGIDIAMSFVVEQRPVIQSTEERVSGFVDSEHGENRRALHVQSLSYWAPANIGPYSQAVAVPIPLGRNAPGTEPEMAMESVSGHENLNPPSRGEIVHVAGQIPLVPASMDVLGSTDFCEQAALSLQHLWRVGRAMNVRWWAGGAVAFLVGETKAATRERAIMAGQIWRMIHEAVLSDYESKVGQGEDDDDEEMDIGDAALYSPWNVAGVAAGSMGTSDKVNRPSLPDWVFVGERYSDGLGRSVKLPPCFSVEVAELPRGAQVEWWSFGFATNDRTIRLELDQSGNGCKFGNMGTIWRACGDVEELREAFASMTRQWPADESRDSRCFIEVFSSHGLTKDVLGETRAMVIPCKSVWNSAGMELFAAVRCRGYAI